MHVSAEEEEAEKALPLDQLHVLQSSAGNFFRVEALDLALHLFFLIQVLNALPKPRKNKRINSQLFDSMTLKD